MSKDKNKPNQPVKLPESPGGVPVGGRPDFFRGQGGGFNKGLKLNSRSFIGMRRGSR